MKIIKLVALLLLSFMGSLSYAQNNKLHIIKFLDSNTGQPISDLTYSYGIQNGLSGDDGTIQFEYLEGTTMYLSHLNYGQWGLSDTEVLEAISQGSYSRERVSVELYPLTIIALRKGDVPEESFHFQYTDKLAHDAASILNQYPGVNSIRKSGNYGYDPVIRGFKYDQLNVVLDGVQSSVAACPNRMDPPTSQMAPNMIERVEIIKGPYGLRFGSGFGATINFIPEPLRFSEALTPYGRLSGSYDSNGDIFRSEAFLGFSNKRYDLGFFASWSEGDDYKDGDGVLVGADFLRASFGTNLGFSMGSNQQLSVKALYNMARNADFPALPMDLRDDDTWMVNLRHKIEFDNIYLRSWNTTVFASIVGHLMDNGLKMLDPRMLDASTTANTYNYGGRTEGRWTFNQASLYAGVDLRVESAEGVRTRSFLLGPNAGKTFEDNAWQQGQIRKTGLFAEYQTKESGYNLIFSMRTEVNDASINDASDEFTEIYSETSSLQINPSFSAGVSKSINEKMKWGLWLGRAQRSGGLAERYINYFPIGQDPFEMLGNPQLKAEKNNQLDLGLDWEDEKIVLQLDIFAAYIQDYISSFIIDDLSPRLPMSPGVRQFSNIDNALLTGFELSFDQDLGRYLNQSISVAYTYGQDLERSEALPEVAPMDFRYKIQANLLEGRLKPELSFRHVLQQDRISNEFGETVTPDFTLLDFNLAYAFGNASSFTIGVNNIFDVLYYEHLNRSVRGTAQAIYAPGRNISLSFNQTF
jgi:iron complex outermembrane receptor protein